MVILLLIIATGFALRGARGQDSVSSDSFGMGLSGVLEDGAAISNTIKIYRTLNPDTSAACLFDGDGAFAETQSARIDELIRQAFYETKKAVGEMQTVLLDPGQDFSECLSDSDSLSLACASLPNTTDSSAELNGEKALFKLQVETVLKSGIADLQDALSTSIGQASTSITALLSGLAGGLVTPTDIASVQAILQGITPAYDLLAQRALIGVFDKIGALIDKYVGGVQRILQSQSQDTLGNYLGDAGGGKPGASGGVIAAELERLIGRIGAIEAEILKSFEGDARGSTCVEDSCSESNSSAQSDLVGGLDQMGALVA